MNLYNPSLGYYTVGSQIFTGKVAALIEATKQNIHAQWNFNNAVFEAVDWSQQPTESLEELYRERAQQLRDKYNYLVLLYSAGSDSQNILDVCLKYNIKIDEVISTWGMSLENSYTPDNTNYAYENVQSEWHFTTKPKLDWLAANHPEIRITIHDWVETAVQTKIQDDYVMDRNHNFSPLAGSRWDFEQVPRLRELMMKSDSVGVISGVCKPKVTIHNGAYHLFFIDVNTFSNSPSFSARLLKSQLNIEFFYWSPDSWKMLVKQAHAMVDFFEQQPQFQQFIKWPIHNAMHRQFYETASRAIIYPHMNLDFFQTRKPHEMNIGYDFLLFPVNQKIQTQITGLQKEIFDYLSTVIDAKYFTVANGKKTIIPFISGMYRIKDCGAKATQKP